MSALDHFTEYNIEMREIARKLGMTLRAEWGMSVKNATTDGLASTLKSNAAKRHGVVDRIGAKFPRHGIFVMKGAGRGQGGSVGSSWRDKTGKTKRTNPNSLGKMNSRNRRAADWLSPSMDRYNEIVADRANHHFATVAQKIVLSGIPETKIRK